LGSRASARTTKEIFLALPPLFKLLVIFVILNTFLVVSISSIQLRVFRNTAIIKSINVGIYWDPNCTNPVEDIDWGVIEPGESKMVMAYMKNEGNWEMSLSIKATGWEPDAAEQYMSFNSDYEGQRIGIGDVMHVALILSLSRDVRDLSVFSFHVVIEASG